jgi:hypothetical protein
MRSFFVYLYLKYTSASENYRDLWGKTKVTLYFDEVIRQHLLTEPIEYRACVINLKSLMKRKKTKKNSESQ